MPNYQTTNIRVSGKKEVIDELLKSVVATEEYLAKIEQRNADIPDDFKIKPAELGCVDFNILIPKPDNIYTGSLGKEEEKKYGSNIWYTWNCSNWGSRWNACYDKVVRIDDENLEISFDTGWDCPFPWFEKFIEKAKELGVEALPISEGLSEQVDYLFLGNSYYAFNIDPEVKAFIANLDKDLVGKIVNFGLAAMLNSTYKKVKAEANKKGIAMDENEFHCKGEFKGLHKGRPNADDLKDAVVFARRYK